ncbi:hypothetical protein KDN24_06990 [Bacillus sp. Bva_UNVM-123]|uniref:hypothetical protein n=1 Tax=Bacillus sp. Bva_UNVM-123 TaxID=2829798 RepID=UPI00391F05A2
MKCKMSECQWCAFEQCCPESKEIYNEAIPNSKECPHYYDLKSTAEVNRKEIIDEINDILKELGGTLSSKHLNELMSMKAKELWSAYEATYDLYRSHRTNLALDEILKEVEKHGVKWVKEKYKIK